jgi:hypothetical protein
MSLYAGGGGYGVSADEYSCGHGAHINSGDLTRYLTYGPLLSPLLVISTPPFVPKPL